MNVTKHSLPIKGLAKPPAGRGWTAKDQTTDALDSTYVDWMPSTGYYLGRGLRQISVAVPVRLLAQFDVRVDEIPFRSRNSVFVEALHHYLTCPYANWEMGDHVKDDDS